MQLFFERTLSQIFTVGFAGYNLLSRPHAMADFWIWLCDRTLDFSSLMSLQKTKSLLIKREMLFLVTNYSLKLKMKAILLIDLNK